MHLSRSLFQTALLLILCATGSCRSSSWCCGDNVTATSTSHRIIDVTEHGVVGDGVHDDTDAMRRLLLQHSVHGQSDRSCCCHKHHVVIPKDAIVLTYPLNLTSCTVLQVDGTLVAMPSTEHWPILPPVGTYGSSENTYQGALVINQYHPYIYAVNASQIRITGRGTIHGNGPYWWDMLRNESAPLQLGGRPNLIQTLRCNDVELDTVTLINAAFWTVHPMLSENIHVHHVTLRAPMYAPNVDGIDPDSCRNVMVEYNDVACGDDHIAIKAGRCGLPTDRMSVNNCTDASWQQLQHSFQTRNVTIRHNVFRTGMGIAVGSESSGGIRDVYIYNNTIGYCASGHDGPTSCGWGPALHLKTTLTRSGSIRDVYFDNNTVWNTSMFVSVETNYQENQQDVPEGYPLTVVRDIYFRNNQALGTATSAQFSCDALDPCREIHVINNTIVDASNNHYNPWGCDYIQSYHVRDNVPGGLEDCMANSMNRTKWSTSKPWERISLPKELWWKHPVAERH